MRYQTDVDGPWVDVPTDDVSQPTERIPLGRFDRPTPVSYCVEADLRDGQTVELRSYFQVRTAVDQPVIPPFPLPELAVATTSGEPSTDPIPELAEEIDLLAMIDPAHDHVQGEWRVVDGVLESPKQYGARIEIPYTPPAEYVLTVIAEPLDPPNALNLGQRLGDRRFVVLCHYATGDTARSALEDVDGKNVGNPTTREGALFQTGRPSLIQVTVRTGRVTAEVDGVRLIDWQGDASRLSLSDYWSTPNADRLFLGAYDCRYRFHRVTLRPLDP